MERATPQRGHRLCWGFGICLRRRLLRFKFNLALFCPAHDADAGGGWQTINLNAPPSALTIVENWTDGWRKRRVRAGHCSSFTEFDGLSWTGCD